MMNTYESHEKQIEKLYVTDVFELYSDNVIAVIERSSADQEMHACLAWLAPGW